MAGVSQEDSETQLVSWDMEVAWEEVRGVFSIGHGVS